MIQVRTKTTMALTIMAVGAARPTAQGHAVTMTANENISEKRAGPVERWQVGGGVGAQGQSTDGAYLQWW